MSTETANSVSALPWEGSRYTKGPPPPYSVSPESDPWPDTLCPAALGSIAHSIANRYVVLISSRVRAPALTGQYKQISFWVDLQNHLRVQQKLNPLEVVGFAVDKCELPPWPDALNAPALIDLFMRGQQSRETKVYSAQLAISLDWDALSWALKDRDIITALEQDRNRHYLPYFKCLVGIDLGIDSLRWDYWFHLEELLLNPVEAAVCQAYVPEPFAQFLQVMTDSTAYEHERRQIEKHLSAGDASAGSP